MRDRVWLLDAVCLNNLNENAFQRNSLLHLGELYRQKDLTNWAFLDSRLEMLEDCHREFWLDSVAEEFLLASVTERVERDQIWPPISDRTVMQSCPCRLHELLKLPKAVSLFPLSSDQSAELMHMWILRQEPGSTWHDHRSMLEQGSEVIGNDICVFLRGTSQRLEKPIDGRSWQLAYHLALRALNSGDADITERLATKWIATGRVENGIVYRVSMENKVSLAGRGRRLLYPSESRNPTDVTENNCVAVPDVHAAWCHVQRSGVRDSGIIHWPENAYVMHTFSSSAIGPVIAAVLLSGVKRVVIWYTDNEKISRQPAIALKEIILKIIAPEVKVEPLREISSNNLQDAESTLREALEPDLASRMPVIFNITQGNRLMALAPYSIARERENLWLVYRDQQATGYDYTAIKFDSSGLVETLTLRGEPQEKHVNWRELLRSSNPPKASDWNEELRKLLLNTSIPNNNM